MADQWSLPAWGAWIEILRSDMSRATGRSLPAWGAWIEIRRYMNIIGEEYVAPRMGSVDRNDEDALATNYYVGRSPHGERG